MVQHCACSLAERNESSASGAELYEYEDYNHMTTSPSFSYIIFVEACAITAAVGMPVVTPTCGFFSFYQSPPVTPAPLNLRPWLLGPCSVAPTHISAVLLEGEDESG
jgi:hypothetical protein